MGERALCEIMRRLAADAAPEGARGPHDLRGIPGTAWRASSPPELEGRAFIRAAFLRGGLGRQGSLPRGYQDPLRERRPASREGPRRAQRTRGGSSWSRPSRPCRAQELDRVHELPYERAWHPMYESLGGVPALSEVKFSLVSSRGCFGGCSFCSIALHQGKAISSRSRESLLREARILASPAGLQGLHPRPRRTDRQFPRLGLRKTETRGYCPERSVSPEALP